MGWATQGGGTTGGKGGTVVTVTTGSQLLAALDNKSPNVPLTILVNATINPANSGTDKIDVKDVRNVSIIGVAARGIFHGIGLKLWRTGNVVLRNLRIHHVSAGEGDAISIAGPTDHVWVDHCEFYSAFQGVAKDTYDGLIDAKDDAQYITYSWNHFHDHWKVNLVGSAEDDTHDRKITMHHNWFENIDGDAPSFRGGQGHIFNNFYEDVETLAINSRQDACLRVENNVFSNVVNPWVTAYSNVTGGVELICNEVDEASTFSFSAQVSEAPACEAELTYSYAAVLNHPSHVEGLVTTYAGVDKLDNPQSF
jgi:pectate lyase